MLKLKYLFENFELAKECMEFYQYDKETQDTMMSFFRISSNAIYPFRTGEEAETICFLRLSPALKKYPERALRTYRVPLIWQRAMEISWGNCMHN